MGGNETQKYFSLLQEVKLQENKIDGKKVGGEALLGKQITLGLLQSRYVLSCQHGGEASVARQGKNEDGQLRCRECVGAMSRCHMH